jgi:C1A family cysteine protease
MKALDSGFPVAIGVRCNNKLYTTIQDANGNKWAQLPKTGDVANSGHAMCVVGYSTEGLLLRNSWGANWGNNGYAWAKFEDVSRNLLDGWVLEIR